MFVPAGSATGLHGTL